MTFDRVYRHNLWNGHESRSGPGSGRAALRTGMALSDLAVAMDARRVLDVGCGDGFWMPDLPGYIGLDVSHEAIERHRRRHPSRTLVLDRGNPLPAADLVIIRFVMQHLSLADGLTLLRRVLLTRPRVIVATTYEDGVNADIESGVDAYRLDLTTAPFNMGDPFATIFDGWDWGDGERVRDAGCVMGLWRGR